MYSSRQGFMIHKPPEPKARGPSRRASAYRSKSTGFHVDFGFQNGFLDFKVDFWISKWISGFHLNRYYSEDTTKI